MIPAVLLPSLSFVRILLDLRCLETASGARGIGRYAREVALRLPRHAPQGWSFAALSWAGAGAALGIEDVSYRGPRRGIGWADRWILPRLFRRERIDLYHSTAYALPGRPEGGTALVLTIHDLVADIYPSDVGFRHRLAFRRTFRSAAAALRVIAVSEWTRRDLTARYAVDPARVLVVPNGVADAFREGTAAARASSGLPAPFLLYVGGLDPSKNVPFLLPVLERVRSEVPEMHLALVGEEGARRDAILRAAQERGLASCVVAPGRLDDARLAAAYREAAAFTFPSRYEGFGLPPLEAMAAGCPVVSSPGGALREVLDGAALLRDLDRVDSWSDAVISLCRDPALREAQVAAGRRRAAAFTWEATARRTIEVYVEAIREADRR